MFDHQGDRQRETLALSASAPRRETPTEREWMCRHLGQRKRKGKRKGKGKRKRKVEVPN